MKENRQVFIIKEAYNKGYRINKQEIVLNTLNKELKPNIKKTGYYTFSIRINGRVSNVFVHKLQAYQKYGNTLFNNDIVVRHYNGNSLDNSEDNILIGTQSDNMMDKSEINRKLDASNPKYNHEDILKSKEEGLSYSEIMLKYNISSKGTISFIVNKSLKMQNLK